ncbi:MAG TPA: MarC family protein [Gemmatimonadales bacterium]
MFGTARSFAGASTSRSPCSCVSWGLPRAEGEPRPCRAVGQRAAVPVGAVVLAWLASAVILYFVGDLRKVLGERGLTAMEQLMGMPLVIVVVEMLMSGLAEYLAR